MVCQEVKSKSGPVICNSFCQQQKIPEIYHLRNLLYKSFYETESYFGAKCCLRVKFYTIPCAVIASATFKNPAMLAPAT